MPCFAFEQGAPAKSQKQGHFLSFLRVFLARGGVSKVAAQKIKMTKQKKNGVANADRLCNPHFFFACSSSLPSGACFDAGEVEASLEMLVDDEPASF